MTTPLKYIKNHLHFDNHKLEEISRDINTPFYLYSANTLKNNFQRFLNSAKEVQLQNPLICFALKSNPNIHLLKILADLGSGADIVSQGELFRALEVGIPAEKIVFSGVGKTREEIHSALNCSLEGIYAFNVESLEELEMINEEAKKLGKIARISFRLNPQVHAKTHKHISTGYKTHKFGILKEDIITSIKKKKYWEYSKLVGLSMHIGSQLSCMKATKKALKQLTELALEINKPLEFLDVGGGLGVNYEKKDEFTTPLEYMQALKEVLKKSFYKKWEHDLPRIVFEPGRVISASTGALITEVIRTKNSADAHFVIVDGGMNDFVRTSLYEAYHEILPIKKSHAQKVRMDIVGPICETADCFASGRMLPKQKPGNKLIINDVGAYGFSMASNYNMRKTTAEYVIDLNGKLID
jgi:diaminopimelate decarboxylase